MKKWVTGNDLVKQWDIRGVELCEYVKRGLQPYDAFGQKMHPPDISEKLSRVEKLDNATREYRSTGGLPREYEKLIREYKPEFLDFNKYIYLDLDAIVDMEYDLKKLKDELANIHDINSWTNYLLPDFPHESKSIIELLLNALYKVEDLNQFKKHQNRFGLLSKNLFLSEDREKSVELAKEYVRESIENGKIPRIVEAVKLIKENQFKNLYKDGTIHNWIKEFFPPESRRPGRIKKS